MERPASCISERESCRTRLIILGFFWIRFRIFFGCLLLCFSCFFASLLSLLLCFSAFPVSLLLCFSAFPVSLLLCFSCFSAFPASLLFCFSAFLLFCFSAFPVSLLLCFFAFLLFCFARFSAFLLLCFSCFSLFCFSALLWCILHSIYIPEYHITYLLLKTDSVTCEKRRLHSALGGGAAPSPQSPLPLLIFKTQARKYISWGWYDDVVNMMVWMLTMTIVRSLHFCEPTFSWKLTALHVRRDACILLSGEALRPPPNPPSRFFISKPKLH